MSLRTIESLTPDVFDRLAQYLEAQDVVKLLSTGSRSLRLVIEQRASLSRVFATFYREPRVWPEFFNRQHHLRHLHVQLASSASAPELSYFTTATLLDLPKTLISIHLGFGSAEQAWLKPGSGNTEFAFDVANVFPSLTSISLAGVSAWRDTVLSYLPECITSLKLHGNTFITSVGIARLPRTLEELEIPKATLMWLEREKVFEALPKSITSITIPAPSTIFPRNTDTGMSVSNAQNSNQPLTSKQLVALFRTLPHLKHISLYGPLPLEEYAELNADLLSVTLYSSHSYWNTTNPTALDFPSHLATLRIRNTYLPSISTALSKLPKSLTFLEVGFAYNLNCTPFFIPERYCVTSKQAANPGNVGFGVESSSFFFAELPRNLVHLDLSTPLFLHEVHFALLPRQLVFLQILTKRKLEDIATMMNGLPKTLQVLHLPTLEMNWRLLRLLPPGLNEFSLTSIELDDCFVPEIQRLLDERKVSAEFCDVSVLDRKNVSSAALLLLPRTYHTWKPLPWLFKITSHVFTNLPQHIQHVDLDCIRPGQDKQPAVVALPNHLQTLVLQKANYFFPEEDPDFALPTGLTTLALEQDQSLPYAFPLPHTLLTLTLTWNETITDEELESFPPTLTHLDLSYNNCITDAGVALLPRTLTYLNLWSNSQLTSQCLGDLPRGLLELFLAQANLAPEALAQLPPQLETLDLGSRRIFNIKDANSLPKTLKTIHWQWNQALYDMCAQVMPRLVLTSVQRGLLAKGHDPKDHVWWELHKA